MVTASGLIINLVVVLLRCRQHRVRLKYTGSDSRLSPGQLFDCKALSTIGKTGSVSSSFNKVFVNTNEAAFLASFASPSIALIMSCIELCCCGTMTSSASTRPKYLTLYMLCHTHSAITPVCPK